MKVCSLVFLSWLLQGNEQQDRRGPGMGIRGRGGGQGGQQRRPPGRGLAGELRPGEQASGRFDDADEADLTPGQQQRRRVSAPHRMTRILNVWLMC